MLKKISLFIFTLLCILQIEKTVHAEEKVVLKPQPIYTTHTITQKEMQDAKAAGVNIYEQLWGMRANQISRFNRLDPAYVWPGSNIRVPNLPAFDDYNPMPDFYPPSANEAKYILVVVHLQFIGLYEYGHLVASFPVCTGTWDHPTPLVSFKITDKNATLKSNLYPKPNGGAPMPMASNFFGTAYWFHGGDMVGYPASHGCVRMFLADAGWLFSWDEIGTPGKLIYSF